MNIVMTKISHNKIKLLSVVSVINNISFVLHLYVTCNSVEQGLILNITNKKYLYEKAAIEIICQYYTSIKSQSVIKCLLNL